MGHHGRKINVAGTDGKPLAGTGNPSTTGRRTESERKANANRPVGPGAGHRGDRRDTHPLHSTGVEKRTGGKPASKGRSTRKN